METDPLELDTLSPANDALIVDRTDDMFLQHGGCATRVVFTEVEEMNVDQYLEDLRIHPNGPEDQITVIRSPSTQSMTLLRGDRVIRYKGCQFQDVLVDYMVRKLMDQTTTMVYTPLSQYPLVHTYVQGNRWVTVSVPKHVVHFFGDSALGNIEDDITMPPLWFCVEMTQLYGVMNGWVAVLDQQAAEAQSCKLRLLCFPNTYTGCSICFGSTRTNVVQYDKLTEGLAVSTTIDRFLNSVHNNHTLENFSSFFQVCKPVYNELEKLPMYEKAISKVANDVLAAGFLRYLRILHEPDGYLRIEQPEVSGATMRNVFLKGLV